MTKMSLALVCRGYTRYHVAPETDKPNALVVVDVLSTLLRGGAEAVVQRKCTGRHEVGPCTSKGRGVLESASANRSRGIECQRSNGLDVVFYNSLLG